MGRTIVKRLFQNMDFINVKIFDYQPQTIFINLK